MDPTQLDHPVDPRRIDWNIANYLRERRQALGLSQKDIGKGVGLSYQQVQKYETGRNRLTCGRLAQISQLLQVSTFTVFNAALGDDFEAPPAADRMAMEVSRMMREMPRQNRQIAYEVMRVLAGKAITLENGE